MKANAAGLKGDLGYVGLDGLDPATYTSGDCPKATTLEAGVVVGVAGGWLTSTCSGTSDVVPAPDLVFTMVHL
jgi:hypothetical protein